MNFVFVSILLIAFPNYLFTQTTTFDEIMWILMLVLLPIPGEAKAKAMPGWLYIHTKNK